jgi:hypothetical protein
VVEDSELIRWRRVASGRLRPGPFSAPGGHSWCSSETEPQPYVVFSEHRLTLLKMYSLSRNGSGKPSMVSLSRIGSGKPSMVSLSRIESGKPSVRAPDLLSQRVAG